jgi:hypothetical protein
MRQRRQMRKMRAKKRRRSSRMSKDTDFETRRNIFEEIKRFNRTELEELYKVLRRAGEEVSENRNGMFFDLLSLKDDTIVKIQELIQFCIENRANFEVREKVMSELIEPV